jgi:hypothetical protein
MNHADFVFVYEIVITKSHVIGNKIHGLSELSWDDQQQIQEQLLQQKEKEKDQQISNSYFPFSKKTKKRQTSLTEFTG